MRRLAAILLLPALAAPLPVASAADRLALRHVTLDLPGPPAKVIPGDLDGDGRDDLLVVLAYAEIEEIGEDRYEGLVQITTVIPAVFDRREVRAYLAASDGSYRHAGSLELPPSVLSLEGGVPGAAAVAVTDAGLSALRYAPSEEGPALRLDPVVDDAPVLAGTGEFFPSLEVVHDLDGDAFPDILLPSRLGPTVYRGSATGIDPVPVQRIDNRATDGASESVLVRTYPTPEVRDLNGDAIADLVFDERFLGDERMPVHVLLGTGDGRFRPLRESPVDCRDAGTDLRVAVTDPEAWPWPDDPAALVDLDGDGRAEAVFREERPRGDSMRQEMKDAKRPESAYTFHRLNDALAVEPEPYFRASVVGHSTDVGDGNGEDLPFAGDAFQDLDGDGRLDLVTLTLDFSLLQAVRILATKKIAIGLEFLVYAQRPDGTFSEVPDLDLTEKLRFDLRKLELGRAAQFAGDFDGDGRRDFVHLGRGRDVTIHAGQPGCRYPRRPDLEIRLDEEPGDLGLVRVEDLDGDGRSDLRVTRPLPATDPDTTPPVRLDLYLSGGAS